MMFICMKEWRQFFSSLTGYIAIILFLLLLGLFLFVFPDSSMLDFGYATLDNFFDIAPFVLLFLVPTITMRSIADEYKSGTFEILRTLPLSPEKIVWGKYFGCLFVVAVALLPTIIYAYCLQLLSSRVNFSLSNFSVRYFVHFKVGLLYGLSVFVISRFSKKIILAFLLALIPTTIYVFSLLLFSDNAGIDIGATIGSYIGLLMLGAVYTSVGICTSSLTNNTVVAFILAAFVCFLLFSGFGAISKLPFFAAGADYYIGMLGADFHYRSISRGVLDTRDVLYFIAVIVIFLLITQRNVTKR